MTSTFEDARDPLRMRVASEVRAFMARHGLTQARVAELAHWRQPYLSRRLTGHVPFDTDDLEALAKIFHVEPEAFLQAPPNRGHIMPIIRRLLMTLV